MIGGMKVEKAMTCLPPERGFNFTPPSMLQLPTYA